jgi:hypothetical protein
MTETPRKSREKTRGRPFVQGNLGKPRGARNKSTVMLEKMMQDDGADVMRAVLAAAKSGDVAAARMIMERLLPPHKDRPVCFKLSPIANPADAANALGEILDAVATGSVTPAEASGVAGLIQIFVRALETTELERRIGELEARK